MAKTHVYIDGFNLYYGLLQRNRLHWLDLQKFSERLNRGQPVNKIIYCTAMVSSSVHDPYKSQRQDAYHRALAIACPNVEIVKGQFATHKKFAILAGCVKFPFCLVKVVVRNEKGSDVNLAARLLHDAHLGRFDKAIVVSGDSDLAEPIRLITQEIGKVVWVRNPRDVSSQELQDVTSDYARIRPDVPRNSQLPTTVTDGIHTYHVPLEWLTPSKAGQKVDVVTVTCPLAGCGKKLKTCQYL